MRWVICRGMSRSVGQSAKRRAINVVFVRKRVDSCCRVSAIRSIVTKELMQPVLGVSHLIAIQKPFCVARGKNDLIPFTEL
mmetsp:Transcript_33261/g.69944  ORF Transcript_33261/g.69944 Transcript_33261/m.69944 type:complete len:81 (-) Transcript_33261:109-351(-)